MEQEEVVEIAGKLESLIWMESHFSGVMRVRHMPGRGNRCSECKQSLRV